MASEEEIFDMLAQPADHASTAHLLDGLKDVSFEDDKGRTLLHQAAAGGNIFAVHAVRNQASRIS